MPTAHTSAHRLSGYARAESPGGVSRIRRELELGALLVDELFSQDDGNGDSVTAMLAIRAFLVECHTG